MRLRLPRWVLTVAILLVAIAPSLAQTPAGEADGNAALIRRQRPSFLVRVAVDRESGWYREGDYLSLSVVSEVDAYVYVVYQQADGKKFQVFPNSHQADNRVKARQAVSIPARDDSFRWSIGAPFGRELVKVIASKTPLDSLSAAELRSKRFNSLSNEQFKGVTLELGEEQPIEWAEDEVVITTVPKNQDLIASGAKRYGLFFGVSQYQFDAEVEERTGHGLNLHVCHRDSKQMAAALREYGALNDVRAFANEQATRATLEQMVTQWLPSVSKPGDTVVIYFSGHGGRIRDDNGDERDQTDEFLVPHDFLNVNAMEVLAKRAKEGKLSSIVRPQYEKALSIIKQSPTLAKADEMLARQTGVTDDLFGHWLQRLSGRQVIVILDVCFSGGFATQEKDVESKDQKVDTFDFLDRELVRLKDIGQDETVLLTASATKETSQERQEQDLSVMTFFLLGAIKQARGPLEIQDAYQECAHGVKEYFQQTNARRAATGLPPLPAHEPQLYNYCRKPVWLKP